MKTKALVFALGATLLMSNAHAHPRVKNSTPAADETLASPPTVLRIELSEAPIAKFSSIKLLDARGRAIAMGPSEVLANNRTVLVAPITLKLDPGDYTVVWYAVGEDAHRVDGRYTFHLKP